MLTQKTIICLRKISPWRDDGNEEENCMKRDIEINTLDKLEVEIADAK